MHKIKEYFERRFMNKALKELVEMYMIFSPSEYEQELSLYVQDKLTKAGVEFKLHGDQVYSLKEGKPLLSAHMDQVSIKPLTKVKVQKGKIKGDGNLGADDKNGVWILLQMIRKFPEEVSFIFSTGEETIVQNDIKDLLRDEKELIKTVPYGLVFDRRGKGDIIGEVNNYCVKEFEDDIAIVGEQFGYKPAVGVFSDADEISKYISCVNISCGYYRAHTENEYTVIKELKNALKFGFAIIKNIKQAYTKPDKLSSWYSDRHDTKGAAWGGYIEKYDIWKCKNCNDIYIEDYLRTIDINSNYICSFCNTKLTYQGKWDDYEIENS